MYIYIYIYIYFFIYIYYTTIYNTGEKYILSAFRMYKAQGSEGKPTQRKREARGAEGRISGEAPIDLSSLWGFGFGGLGFRGLGFRV